MGLSKSSKKFEQRHLSTKKLSGHGTRRTLPGRAADEVQVGMA
jgi:hypothetical protein